MFQVQIYQNHAYRQAARFVSVNRCSAFLQGNHQHKPPTGKFRVLDRHGLVKLSGRVNANGSVDFS